jgi:hypothetical protein
VSDNLLTVARFQALTNPVLDEELETLRERFGLAPSQKAELLREVASLASWIVHQVERGRTIQARRGTSIESLRHPAIDRIAERTDPSLDRIALTDAEVQQLARILDRPFKPTRALRKVLANLASPKRRSPTLRWKHVG